VDHGKSTLADRFLEITKTIPKEKMKPQYLDMMDLERERGVTIKMAPVRMNYYLSPKSYILNLIDTPGHVDFSYEVSRALAAVEGALLLVDATQGIQAQTLLNLEKARKAGLKIIPVINKIDLPSAEIEKTKKELQGLGFKEQDIIKISAKTGENIEEVLKKIVLEIPPPSDNSSKPLKALIFDSLYDPYKGVIAYIRVFDGKVKRGDKIEFLATHLKGEALEVGYFKPALSPCERISAGEIGYIKTDLKDISKIKIGDTITLNPIPHNLSPIKGYQEPQPMVYASIYPIEGGEYHKLKNALLKLKLNDASLIFQSENSKTLGAGFRCGFLGVFHLEITKERLERDFDLDIVITKPTVDIRKLDSVYQEPYVRLEIITPRMCFGKIMELAKNHRANFKEMKYLDERVILIYEAPLSEIIIDFYNQLKSISSGFASMSYQLIGYRNADLVKLDILIAKEKVEPFSQIVPKEKVEIIARELLKKLKELIPRHLFEISLQAAIGGKIIASEKIPALRKDVTAPLYGGDVTRKRKLLEKQAAGKKKLKRFGKVDIPSDIFLKIVKT
jgi:GTP-binding protein LepA